MKLPFFYAQHAYYVKHTIAVLLFYQSVYFTLMCKITIYTLKFVVADLIRKRNGNFKFYGVCLGIGLVIELPDQFRLGLMFQSQENKVVSAHIEQENKQKPYGE